MVDVHARPDGPRRHPRPAGRRLSPLRDRPLLDRPALREDALRQRPARLGPPGRVRDHRRPALARRGRGDLRVRRPDDDRAGGRLLLGPRRRDQGRGGGVLRLDPRRGEGGPGRGTGRRSPSPRSTVCSGEPNFEGGRYVLLEPRTQGRAGRGAQDSRPRSSKRGSRPLRARLLAARDKRPAPLLRRQGPDRAGTA